VAVSDSGLDFQTAALAIGLVGGLTFLIAQARSYLDRAISDTRLEVIRQEAELQRARASNSIYLAGRLTLARYSNGPRLAEVVIQATKGLIRRPLPAENAQPAIFERRAAWWNRHGMSADLSRTQSALDDYSRRSQAHSLDEPSGISISFVILFSAIIFSLSVAALMMAMLLSVGWSHLSAHPAVTGITVVVLAAFMVFLAAIAWLTARDAVFELVMLSGSESVTISRWLKSSADHLGRMHIAERFPDGKASSIVTERDLSLRGCASALRIYPLIGQALHIQGVLCAAELE
jgi:hypothetical protein